jgi:hypothetical protein
VVKGMGDLGVEDDDDDDDDERKGSAYIIIRGNNGFCKS